MICSVALRLGSRDAAGRLALLLIILIWLPACAGSSARPVNALPTQLAPPDSVNKVADLLTEAESYFVQGEEAYRRGEYGTADDRFQRALDV